MSGKLGKLVASISEITDLYDKSGEAHSNSKVMSLIVIGSEIVLWATLKFTGKSISWEDVALLVSLVIATQSVRALLAFWRGGKPNGNGAPVG